MAHEVFDLAKIKRLVDDKQPDVVVIVDTNIVFKEPHFPDWKVTCGKALFVISDVIIIELEHLKNRRNDPDTCKASRKSIAKIGELFKKGNVTEGIYVEDVGWFISVPSPRESKVKPELDELASIVKAFGVSDARLLLLAKQILETIPNSPTVLMTADISLFNIVSGNGIPAFLFQGFPVAELGKHLTGLTVSKEADWDRVLVDIQTEAEAKSVDVTLTMTAKRRAPRWIMVDCPSDSTLFVAEGHGAIHLHGGIGFSWALPYTEWDYQFVKPDSAGKLVPQPVFWSKKAYLDFFGQDVPISAEFIQNLSEKIAMFSFPFAHLIGLPTVAGPVSVVKYFYHLTYLAEELYERSGSSDEAFIEFAEDYIEQSDFAGFGANIFARLAAHPDEDKTFQGLIDLLTALENCWSIGDTKTIKIPMGSIN